MGVNEAGRTNNDSNKDPSRQQKSYRKRGACSDLESRHPPPPHTHTTHCPFLRSRAKDTQSCDSQQTGKTKRHTHSALKVGFSLDGGLLGLRYLSWNSSGMLKGTATLNGPSNSPTVKHSASPSVARQSTTIVRQKGDGILPLQSGH